jgi:hypothetical protein
MIVVKSMCLDECVEREMDDSEGFWVREEGCQWTFVIVLPGVNFLEAI